MLAFDAKWSFVTFPMDVTKKHNSGSDHVYERELIKRRELFPRLAETSIVNRLKCLQMKESLEAWTSSACKHSVTLDWPEGGGSVRRERYCSRTSLAVLRHGPGLGVGVMPRTAFACIGRTRHWLGYSTGPLCRPVFVCIYRLGQHVRHSQQIGPKKKERKKVVLKVNDCEWKPIWNELSCGFCGLS